MLRRRTPPVKYFQPWRLVSLQNFLNRSLTSLEPSWNQTIMFANTKIQLVCGNCNNASTTLTEGIYLSSLQKVDCLLNVCNIGSTYYSMEHSGLIKLRTISGGWAPNSAVSKLNSPFTFSVSLAKVFLHKERIGGASRRTRFVQHFATL